MLPARRRFYRETCMCGGRRQRASLGGAGCGQVVGALLNSIVSQRWGVGSDQTADAWADKFRTHGRFYHGRSAFVDPFFVILYLPP